MARRERTREEIDAFNGFNSDWEVVTPEDISVKRSLKRKLRTAVLKAAESMSTWESDDNDEDDSTPDAIEIAASTSLSLPRSRAAAAASAADDTDDTVEITTGPPRPLTRYSLNGRPATLRPGIINSLRPSPIQDAVEWLENRPNCVLNFLFPCASFHLLQERNWLPATYGSLRLIYELDLNHLIVHLASPAHDAAANSFNFIVDHWSSNCNIMNTTLLQLGEANWTHTPGSEKSPDQSWYPMALTCPPALVIPGTTNCPYPTMVIEVSRTNESYQQLLDDATLKHFSNNTSVQVWVGAKLFAGHGGRMKCMFRLRDQVNGGALQGSGASTDFISLGQPTTIQFIIPKTRIFWGVNPPLPMTFQSTPGPNALPPPAIPGIVTDDLILPLERLRYAAARCW